MKRENKLVHFFLGSRIGWCAHGNQKHRDVQYNSWSKSYCNFFDIFGCKTFRFVCRDASCKNDSICLEKIYQREKRSCTEGEVLFEFLKKKYFSFVLFVYKLTFSFLIFDKKIFFLNKFYLFDTFSLFIKKMMMLDDMP